MFKKDLLLLCISVLTAVCANCEICNAQERSDDFFSKDFANKQVDERAPMAGFEFTPQAKKLKPQVKPEPKQAIVKNSTQASNDFAAVGHDPVQVAVQPGTDTAEGAGLFGEGINIKWIGLIVNGREVSHAKENLNELSELASKYDWTIGPIFSIGGVKDLASDWPLLSKLIFRGGIFEYRDVVPSNYKNVQMSPAWIVQTDKGQVVLEAMGDLKKQINQQGQLVLKNQAAL